MCTYNFVYVELFQTFFNILYEEKIDCKLVTSALVDDRMLNWNRINAVICFNYLQQEFYLVTPTMKTLAAGKNNTAILKLLRVLISTCQGNYGDQNMDDEYIRDIADVIERDVPAAEGEVDVNALPKKPKGCGAIAMGLESKKNAKFNHIEEQLLGPQADNQEELKQ